MATYTASDFCQGHGGGRECTYSPEVDGCLQHGEDFDHGVISYCDGTCTEAIEEYRRYLEAHGLFDSLRASTSYITLEVWDSTLSYRVVFEGADAEEWALAYMAARPSLHFTEAPEAPNHLPAFPGLAAKLYPTCHHGLALDLCMDPYGENHFGTREQELAQGW